MEKIISYVLTPQGVSPSEAVCGGAQGEHRAVALVFAPDDTVADQIQKAQEDGYEVTCKTDLVTADGVWFYGEEKDISLISQPFYLTSEMTCSGLDAVAIFVVTLKEQGGGKKEFYKAQAKLYFEASPMSYHGAACKRENKTDALDKKAEEIFKVLEQKTALADELISSKAELATEAASVTAQQLKKVIKLADETEKTSLALRQGREFVFVGGDASGSAEVALVPDEELSEESGNPVQNKAITKKIIELEAAADNDRKDIEANRTAIDQNALAVEEALSLTEKASNKVAAVDDSSTDEQYPSAKCVYGLENRIKLLEGLKVNRSFITNTSLIEWCEANAREGIQLIQIGAGVPDAPEALVHALYICNNVTDGGANSRRTLIIPGKSGSLYVRVYIVGAATDSEYKGWLSWYKFSGSEITL